MKTPLPIVDDTSPLANTRNSASDESSDLRVWRAYASLEELEDTNEELMRLIRETHEWAQRTVVPSLAQSYSDVTTQTRTFGLYSSSATDYLLGHQATLCDGSTRIAGIRMRVKHDVSSDTVAITDSLQMTCLAIDDSSGNINRTYSSGTLS